MYSSNYYGRILFTPPPPTETYLISTSNLIINRFIQNEQSPNHPYACFLINKYLFIIFLTIKCSNNEAATRIDNLMTLHLEASFRLYNQTVSIPSPITRLGLRFGNGNLQAIIFDSLFASEIIFFSRSVI